MEPESVPAKSASKGSAPAAIVVGQPVIPHLQRGPEKQWRPSEGDAGAISLMGNTGIDRHGRPNLAGVIITILKRRFLGGQSLEEVEVSKMGYGVRVSTVLLRVASKVISWLNILWEKGVAGVVEAASGGRLTGGQVGRMLVCAGVALTLAWLKRRRNLARMIAN